MKILILGGYGAFGARLAGLLTDLAEIEIVISGRNLAAARTFCEMFPGPAKATPYRLDRSHVATALAELKPDMLVDASGPFQDYGEDCYAVVRACIAAGVDYLDFADGAAFVAGIDDHDAAARAAGVLVLSGVSSFPVLTAAVLRDMAQDMTISSVTCGIAPSPYAGVGLNVIRAVLGYAGNPVTLTRNGQPATAIGLGESLRRTIAVPGHLPLQNLHFSLVEVPDLHVIPGEHPGLRDIWVGAAPVPEFLHRLLNVLALARAHLHLPTLAPLAPVAYRLLNWLKFGAHRGGMFIQASGRRDGQTIERTWHLIAEGDDGPYIPSMAIEALVRKCLAGQRPASGARAATRALDIADYHALFGARTIYAGYRETVDPATPLFRRVLGVAYDGLPRAVAALHDERQSAQWSGKAQVRRGRGIMAGAVARLFGFPPETDETPVSVTIQHDKGAEIWTRDFGGQKFSSVLTEGQGRNSHLICERFGIASFGLALVVEGERLYLVPRRWTVLGVPMPRFLMPGGTSFEAEIEGCFAFDVEIRLPIIGLIVAYRGSLSPVSPR